MQIHVRGQSNTHVLECSENDTLYAIRERAATLENLPSRLISLFGSGRQLTDNLVVGELENLDLEITIPLLGGKVHGSLARAGKVKGQTPKVEKEERKRKKKTGRAKRRIQYNLRFTQEVATFGRRRGPNSKT